MPVSLKHPDPALHLRGVAEDQLARAPKGQADVRPTTELLHELQVHQIELQMQNETLREAQFALEESRDRFVDFYEFAPVGYLTITDKGAIAGINLTGAAMLGVERSKLLQLRFASFVTPDTESLWYSHLAIMLKHEGKLNCELSLRRNAGLPLHVRLDSLRLDKNNQAPTVRVVLTDITQRKRAEQQLADMMAGLEQQVSERTQQLRMVSEQLIRTEERERRMLAQDLHDNLIQLLFVIKIKLGQLDPDASYSSVDHIIELVAQTEHAARTTMQQLSLPVLETLGLTPALGWLADQLENTHHLTVHFDSEGEPKPLNDEMQTFLFRAARELLINVARHAKSSDTNLSCLWEESRLVIVVGDDGVGFDAANFLSAPPNPIHFGLRSIYERMINIGGEIEIDSSPGNGTTTVLSVPYSILADRVQLS